MNEINNTLNDALKYIIVGATLTALYYALKNPARKGLEKIMQGLDKGTDWIDKKLIEVMNKRSPQRYYNENRKYDITPKQTKEQNFSNNYNENQ